MEEPPIAGYPDAGNGFFGQHLSYAEWYTLAKAQRLQGNFLELIFVTALWMTVCATYNPLAAIIVSSLIVFGRFLYTLGYGFGSVNARLPGALCMNCATFAAFILACIACFQGTGKSGVYKTIPFAK
jgi:uncharacterized membrane protein YecN with MAPEG domain